MNAESDINKGPLEVNPLEEPLRLFDGGDYVSSRIALENLLKERPEDAELKREALALKRKINIDRIALLVGAIYLGLLLLIAYLGIFEG